MTEQMPYDQKMMMDAVAVAAQILTPQADNFAALVRAEQRSHSFLHITDPTLYRNMINSANFKAQVDLARAAIAFIVAVQKVKADLAGGAE